MRTGTIVLASKRGFYFVADDKTAEQFFLHQSAVAGRILLRSGDRVTFRIEENPQGRDRARAVDASRIAAAVIGKDEDYGQAKQ